jgi:hypothetical protein
VQLPVHGHPVHTRSLTAVLRQRGAGRVWVRGDVIDLRKTGFNGLLGDLQTPGIIHHMQIRAEVDAGRRVLEHLETAQPVVAVEPGERTGGVSCRDSAPRLQALVGERFDSDFLSRLGEVYGGPRGCTHLLTLFHLIASTLPRALDLEQARAREQAARADGEPIYRCSALIDGFRTDGGMQLAVQLYDVLQTPLAALGSSGGGFLHYHEVRVLGALELRSLALRELRAWQRERGAAVPGEGAQWRERSAELAPLLGEPIMPGLGAKALRALGTGPDRDRLALAVLQLTPAFVQSAAALVDSDAAARGGQRDLMQRGGGIDSCYVWRADSPLIHIRGSGGK